MPEGHRKQLRVFSFFPSISFFLRRNQKERNGQIKKDI